MRQDLRYIFNACILFYNKRIDFPAEAEYSQFCLFYFRYYYDIKAFKLI